jgi:hypothetical protein
MYFADLTEYRYGTTSPRPDVLNIGWLSKNHAFPQGRSDPSFVAKLERLVASPIMLSRGSHLCEFCPRPPTVLSKGGIPMLAPAPGTTGNGQIRVNYRKGGALVAYMAPVLVLHYVLEHHYLPPQEFIDAVNALLP